MKDEIVGGLRNALDRGQSLEDAVKSFVNAGYNPGEVREAANIIVPSATALLQPTQVSSPLPPPVSVPRSPSAQAPATPQAVTLPPSAVASQQNLVNSTENRSAATPVQPLPSFSSTVRQQVPMNFSASAPKKSNKTVIVLITVFIILVALLIVTLLYSDQILNLFFAS